MKWIQGKWETNGAVVLINPTYITAIDLSRKLLWAEDCNEGVRWEDDELELINKLTGRPADEELKENGATNKQNKTSTKSSK